MSISTVRFAPSFPARPAASRASAPAVAPQPETPTTAPAPAPTAGKATPLQRFLNKLPEYPRGAVVGFGTLTPPMVGGMLGGIPGAVLGGLVAFGFQYAIDKDARRALSTCFLPTLLLGGFSATSTVAVTPLRLALAIGFGPAMGALAVLRARVESQINEKPDKPAAAKPSPQKP